MTDDAKQEREAVLLPCPFCGGVQIEAFHHLDRGWGASWHVECVAEECGNSTCHHDTEATAIAAWNRRQPQTDALKIEIEKLRRDHAAAVKEANIAKARLKGVQKQWYADRTALEQSK